MLKSVNSIALPFKIVHICVDSSQSYHLRAGKAVFEIFWVKISSMKIIVCVDWFYM